MAISEVSQIIFQQINGKRLQIMVGAHTFIDHGNGLSFKFKMCKRANYIKITLNELDLYDVEIGKMRGTTYKVIAEHTGIYFDMLLPLFRDETGLATNL